jgi:peroxiredoxin
VLTPSPVTGIAAFERDSGLPCKQLTARRTQNAFSRLGLKCGPSSQAGVVANLPTTTQYEPSALEVSMSENSQVSSGRSKSPLRYIVMAVIAGVIACTGYFAFGGQQRVPDATFTLLSGQKISTSTDLKGKVYLINFWATDCETCMKEMPAMVDTYNRFKGRGLEFVAVAMKYDAPMYVTNYAQTRNLPFKVAMDDGSAAKQFGNVQLTPTTFVVDKDGKILKRYVGEPTFAELDALLDKALNAV